MNNYIIPFSSKIYFCIFLMVLYLVIANHGTYKIVGHILGFNEYDNFRSYDRYYLLVIHSIVFSLIVFIVLSFYNPFVFHSKK